MTVSRYGAFLWAWQSETLGTFVNYYRYRERCETF